MSVLCKTSFWRSCMKLYKASIFVLLAFILVGCPGSQKEVSTRVDRRTTEITTPRDVFTPRQTRQIRDIVRGVVQEESTKSTTVVLQALDSHDRKMTRQHKELKRAICEGCGKKKKLKMAETVIKAPKKPRVAQETPSKKKKRCLDCDDYPGCIG
jgi:hypothetical protein